VVHGAPGPFNTIFRDRRPVVFIDWDSARPGDHRLLADNQDTFRRGLS